MVYQIIMISFFWGKRRGEFEYSFLESSEERGKSNPILRSRLKEVKKELKMGDPKSAHLKIESVRKEYPEKFVVHIKYAISCERVGAADDALAAYKTAGNLIPKSEKALTQYIEKQIVRLKRKALLKDQRHQTSNTQSIRREL